MAIGPVQIYKTTTKEVLEYLPFAVGLGLGGAAYAIGNGLFKVPIKGTFGFGLGDALALGGGYFMLNNRPLEGAGRIATSLASKIARTGIPQGGVSNPVGAGMFVSYALIKFAEAIGGLAGVQTAVARAFPGYNMVSEYMNGLSSTLGGFPGYNVSQSMGMGFANAMKGFSQPRSAAGIDSTGDYFTPDQGYTTVNNYEMSQTFNRYARPQMTFSQVKE